MHRIAPKLLENLQGKDLIAYGTGNTGMLVIPYLVQDESVKIQGVTNSRISSDDVGTYLDTGLPIRSIHAWAKMLPHATILVTAFRGLDVIYGRCVEAGFKEILVLDWDLVDAISDVMESAAEARQSDLLDAMCLANEIHETHKASFSKFKACHRGHSVVVAGSGPTLLYYTQMPGIPHIGVNSTFSKLDLDYYFLLHFVPEWCDRLRDQRCVKFFWVNRRNNSDTTFPEYAIEEHGARMFYNTVTSSKLHTNIDYYPLAGFHSVIFPAIQFALYTRPKKILLVGCDCSSDGHFDGVSIGRYQGQNSTKIWSSAYQKIKTFTQLHYPDTEIISVNPVGLRGMFRDVYTKSYLDDHPELDPAVCELFDAANYAEGGDL